MNSLVCLFDTDYNVFVMNLLEQKIFKNIEEEGPIPFETFMSMALYEPLLGYYTSDKIEFGKAGDFFTSHHLHPAFGAMIGKQLLEMWDTMGRPSNFYTVELGPGAGLLCMDILNFLKKYDLFNSLTYVIVEVNPFLKHKQEQLLNRYLDKVNWVSFLEEIPAISGCILSNELLDSFPVHVIEMDNELKEIYVAVDNGRFYETKGNPSTEKLVDYLHEYLINLPHGYRSEINLRIKDWLGSVSKILLEGFILTIDYGYPARDYYGEDRNRGTLLCYYRHQFNEDPYQHVGEQDITAHVNFSSVKKWGEEFEFQTIGFCQQGVFLVSLGIDEIMSGLYEKSSDYLFEIAKIKRLILPGTIGETHKVMIQYKGKAAPKLRGFQIKNQVDKL